MFKLKSVKNKDGIKHTSLYKYNNAIKTEKDVVFLVDSMIGLKGTVLTFTFFRYKAQKNTEGITGLNYTLTIFFKF